MKRGKFSLSNYKLLSCDMGELVPCGLTEVLPGDSIQQASSALVRLSPLVAPMMHPVEIRIHHWFVPNRLIWDGWEDFITGGPDGMNDDTIPYRTLSSNPAVGSLADYLGIPTSVTAGLNISALPFRAYALIWNEWYRDQDLQAELVISKASGADTTTNTALQNVAWEKDYFTSSRPWPQKGPEVTIPLGSTAPLFNRGLAGTDADPSLVRIASTGALNTVANAVSSTNVGVAVNNSSTPLQLDVTPHTVADLSNASAASINELREAFALQRYAEARARYGSRYTEYLRYLGVRSSDARLQRPEYLGGGKQRLQVSEVLQTAPTTDGDDDEGVGNLKGHGIGALRSNRYRRFFEEHGFILSVLSVKPKTMYMQGIPRSWSRFTKEDYYQKELQHIGQQEVLNKELYAVHASPNGVFGYQDRYDEYRRTESTVAGEFRTTLNFWHMARDFGSTPALNSDFIKSVPTKRVNAVQTEDVLWVMVNHSIQARRLLAPVGSSFIY